MASGRKNVAALVSFRTRGGPQVVEAPCAQRARLLL